MKRFIEYKEDPFTKELEIISILRYKIFHQGMNKSKIDTINKNKCKFKIDYIESLYIKCMNSNKEWK